MKKADNPPAAKTKRLRELTTEFQQLEKQLRLGGGAEKIDRQHQQGKLTARERINLLLDTDSYSQEIGLLVAYVLPGFILLAGMAPLLPVVGHWLTPVDNGDLGIGPPIYAVLAATALGLIISTFRWILIDHLHEWTGVRRPTWNDSQLHGVLDGFDYLVQSHYRYYEFTANTLLALIGVYGVNRFFDTLPFLGVGTDLGMVVLCLVLFTASRDALVKYFDRSGRLLGRIAEKEFRGDDMFNGNDHSHEGGATKEPKPAKPQPQQPAPQKPQPTTSKTSQKK